MNLRNSKKRFHNLYFISIQASFEDAEMLYGLSRFLENAPMIQRDNISLAKIASFLLNFPLKKSKHGGEYTFVFRGFPKKFNNNDISQCNSKIKRIS